jgi:tRNA pseudouridine55 synthase
VHLGIATDTYDAEGAPAGAPWTGAMPARDAIERVLDEFRGTFLQQPPAYSAKKIDGERSYASARAGKTILHEPVSVTVAGLAIIDLKGTDLTLKIECSAGFYVRALAHDIGQRLGIGAHLAALRRTESSGLTLLDATPLEFAEQSKEDAMDAVVPMESMLPQFGQVVLTDETLLQAVHGRNISAAAPVSGPVRLVDQLGQLVGIGEPTSVPGVLHPAVVLR